MTEAQAKDRAEHEAALQRFGGKMPKGGKPGPKAAGHLRVKVDGHNGARVLTWAIGQGICGDVHDYTPEP